jgi:hypothetical protein
LEYHAHPMTARMMMTMTVTHALAALDM